MNNQLFNNNELLQKIRGIDLKERNRALQFLYDDVYIKNTIKRLVQESKDKADTDEVLQLSMIALDRNVRNGHFKGKSTLKTYLIAISKFVIKNKVRSGQKLIFKETINDSDTEDIPLELSAETSIINHEEAETKNKILRSFIKQLSEKCQQVVLLEYFENKSKAEIAQETGFKNDHQVNKKLSTCRKELKDIIEEQLTKQPTLITLLREK